MSFVHELRAGAGADVLGEEADVVGREDDTGADVVGALDVRGVDEALVVGRGVDGLVSIGGVPVTSGGDDVGVVVDPAVVLGPDGLLVAVHAPSERAATRPSTTATPLVTCRSAGRSSTAGC